MINYEEEERQITQKAFQHLLQNTDHITLAMRAPLAAYDRTHTPTESLDMRLESIAATQLESKKPNALLNTQADYLSKLAAVGTDENKQDYLDNEKIVLENLKSPKNIVTNEVAYYQTDRSPFER
ncbi:hypothetical protein [Listeria fleischmannii]|uniref:hypothetical protein n=1 Tax=Listeria fleischmannii TaxID=1069827 RepID=UPI00162991F2|nr:hypothetical protein [Listeria fleischmannii]MBC1419891.1 hypothetical protein [Listeria fleischmannii]